MHYSVLNPGCIATSGLPCFPFARHYSENLFWFLFLALLRCFSSGGVPSHTYVFSIRWPEMNPAGFPHSEIHGSKAICAYPWLIAAYHVFLRLLMPRHSPCALSNLTSLFQVFVLYLSFYRIIWVSVIPFFRNCLYPNISIRLPVSFLKILKITFLLDFLHYSVDNLHLRHKVSKVIALRTLLFSFILLLQYRPRNVVANLVYYGSP